MRTLYALTILSTLMLGCGGPGGEGTAGPGDVCDTTSDCDSDSVCIQFGGEGVCQVNCTARADACGAEATCEGVGSAAIDVCQDDDQVADPDDPATSPEERPYIPCASDAECEALFDGGVCGTWMGIRECTIRCDAASSTDTCNPPAMGGMESHFMECTTDEGDPSRTICAPDPDCFNSPMDCVSFDG